MSNTMIQIGRVLINPDHITHINFDGQAMASREGADIKAIVAIVIETTDGRFEYPENNFALDTLEEELRSMFHIKYVDHYFRAEQP